MNKKRHQYRVVDGHRAAEEILLLCTTAIISPETKTCLAQIISKPVDWKYFIELVTFHGTMPLIAHNLVNYDFSSQIPQPYVKQMKNGYNGTVYRNVVLSHELSNILSAFNQHAIETIPLKGTILAETLYGNPCMRSVVDIDILVHHADIPLAGTVLGRLGYKQPISESDHPFHGAPYRKNGSFPIILDLHWALDDSRLVAFTEDELWHRTVQTQFHGVPCLVLSPEDNLLFLANHLSKNEIHLLKFLGDIAELLKKYEGTLDWDYIIKAARSWQIEVAVYYGLRRVRELLGAPVPVYSLEKLRPRVWRWWMLNFLINQETFVSPIRWNRLRSETSALIRSLMVKGPRRSMTVLARNRGPGKKGMWPRTAFWVVVALGASLLRQATRFLTRQAPLSPR